MHKILLIEKYVFFRGQVTAFYKIFVKNRIFYTSFLGTVHFVGCIRIVNQTTY